MKPPPENPGRFNLTTQGVSENFADYLSTMWKTGVS